MFLYKLLFSGTKAIADKLLWAGPLLTRLMVGYTFMVTGWGKLNNLERITEYFTSLGIPFPHILTPFTSGLEFIGGIFLILGFLTRISAGGLAVVMVVAIISAKLGDITVLSDLTGFEETTYFVVFVWLAIAGAGKASLDYLMERFINSNYPHYR